MCQFGIFRFHIIVLRRGVERADQDKASRPHGRVARPGVIASITRRQAHTTASGATPLISMYKGKWKCANLAYFHFHINVCKREANDWAMIDIIEIRQLCEKGSLRWTNHVFVRLAQRKIDTAEVISALLNREIIEHYPEDYPYPSCLVHGWFTNDDPLHVVCGIGDGELWIITAYRPNQEEWSVDLKTRKDTEK